MDDKKVIIVDDDKINRTQLMKLIKSLSKNYEVHCFPGVDEAIEYLDLNKVNVAIIDQVMDKKNGVVLFNYMRLNQPEAGLILHTAYSNIPLMIESLNCSIGSQVVKKASPQSEMIAAFNNALEFNQEEMFKRRVTQRRKRMPSITTGWQSTIKEAMTSAMTSDNENEEGYAISQYLQFLIDMSLGSKNQSNFSVVEMDYFQAMQFSAVPNLDTDQIDVNGLESMLKAARFSFQGDQSALSPETSRFLYQFIRSLYVFGPSQKAISKNKGGIEIVMVSQNGKSSLLDSIFLTDDRMGAIEKHGIFYGLIKSVYKIGGIMSYAMSKGVLHSITFKVSPILKED